MSPKELFTVPIAPCDPHPGGSIVATQPYPAVYLLTFSSPSDNRLTTPFCAAMLRALDLIEFGDYGPPGVVVTTSAIPKFYSNGLDLDHAQDNAPGYWTGALYPLFRRFLAYPMPTVALVNGHAFAGGAMLAMHHDYRVMNPAKGFLCLNELDFGAPLKAPMAGVFRLKVADPAVYRRVVLEAHRFPGPQALEAGLVDALGGLDDGVMAQLVGPRGLVAKGRTGVYGFLKMQMYREQLGYLTAAGFDADEARDAALLALEDERIDKGKEAVARWKAEAAAGGEAPKAKL
ncbi:uncharacterized protein E0L32_009694 [Thyridium curvatum]|uniref:Uncharacterized protein n=1 Tax=Thyridium curvatum TaxID=1093900 RepID=A0A507AQC1_9PEZI|nr:uncharacterized protein E0L32_009694 [Thyridium curvatum]TPX08876.1 hypothetical protein E0L32_009694 [Thyridium curvatum]